LFSPEAGGARTVGSSPILCLKRFPVWGEATEKGVEETYFRLMALPASLSKPTMLQPTLPHHPVKKFSYARAGSHAPHIFSHPYGNYEIQPDPSYNHTDSNDDQR